MLVHHTNYFPRDPHLQPAEFAGGDCFYENMQNFFQKVNLLCVFHTALSYPMQMLMHRRELGLSRSLTQHRRRRAGPSLCRKRRQEMTSLSTGKNLTQALKAMYQ